MNIDKLNEVIDIATERARSTLARKNKKYNPGDNKLEHFYQDYEILEVRLNIAITYAKKHWTKIRTMSGHADLYSMQEWTESLDDLVNYMHLLECLLIDSGEITCQTKDPTNQD